MPTLFEKRDFSAKRRRHLASTGAAMPGGRFPIENQEDLDNAMRLLHQAPDRGAVRAHIRSKARSLGLSDPIQKDWAEWDAQRPQGAGERTGRVGGLVTGIFHSPRVGRAVAHVLLRHGIRRVPAFGAGAVVAYGAARGAQAAGGYIGRKVDETVNRVFKGTVEQTMHEYKHGKLRSGSKHGPKVTDRKQAVAIAMSQAGLSNK